MDTLYDFAGKAIGFVDKKSGNQETLYGGNNQFLGYSNSNGTYDANSSKISQPGMLGFLLGKDEE